MTQISIAFRELASVFEALETANVESELTTVTPRDDEVAQSETVSVDASVRIPFLSKDAMDCPTRVVAETVSLIDDGALEVNFQLTATPDNGVCSSQTDQNTNSAATHKTDGAAVEESQDEQTDTNPSPSTACEVDTNKEVSRPAYRDPDRLEAVYETHETFQEMTEALEVDVTPQTVRRYMIKHGIHTPSSTTGQRAATMLLETDAEDVFDGEGPNTRLKKGVDSPNDVDTDETTVGMENGEQSTPGNPQNTTGPHPASNAEHSSEDEVTSESPSEECPTAKERTYEDAAESTRHKESVIAQTHAADGEQTVTGTQSAEQSQRRADEPDIDLPDHLTIEQVKTTVRNAKTLYDVQQDLEIDRERAQSLLQELNLLDLVHGRLSTRGLQERTMEEINRRIQTTSSNSIAQSSTTHG